MIFEGVLKLNLQPNMRDNCLDLVWENLNFKNCDSTSDFQVKSFHVNLFMQISIIFNDSGSIYLGYYLKAAHKNT